MQFDFMDPVFESYPNEENYEPAVTHIAVASVPEAQIGVRPVEDEKDVLELLYGNESSRMKKRSERDEEDYVGSSGSSSEDELLECPNRGGRPMGQRECLDITQYLHEPQQIVAQKIGIPTSTLSKRWKEATRGKRTWPHRKVLKLDKEIQTYIDYSRKYVDEDADDKIENLRNERRLLLKPVTIMVPQHVVNKSRYQ